jgi:hypothetical protein
VSSARRGRHRRYWQSTPGRRRTAVRRIPWRSGVGVQDRQNDGRSLDDYGPGGGFDCLWMLNNDPPSVHWLFSHLDAGVSGLSVEMRVYRDQQVREGWKHPDVRHVHEAVLTAVAMVPNPSYITAHVDAVVTPEESWYRHRRVGILVPDVETFLMTTVHQIDYDNALRRSERVPVSAVPTSTPEARAADRGSRFADRPMPPLELRKIHINA